MKRLKHAAGWLLLILLLMSGVLSVVAKSGETIHEDVVRGALTESKVLPGRNNENQMADTLSRRRYLASGTFPGTYGLELTSGPKKMYDAMVTAWYSKGNTGAITFTFNPTYSFYTTGTVSNGTLIWDKESNSQYQDANTQIVYNLQSAYDAFAYDYPEVFWLGGVTYSYKIKYTATGGKYKGEIAQVTVTPKYEYSTAVNEKASVASVLNSAVSEIRSSLPAGANRYTIAKAVHDWICRRTFYQANSYAYNIGGVFLHYSSGVVCEGYAKTFKVLFDRLTGARTNCVLVVGYAGENHMWNYIKAENGGWYLVDVTWDDAATISYDYFMVGSGTVVGSKMIANSRQLYTNFSNAANTTNFYYPSLSASAYQTAGSSDHSHQWITDSEKKATCTIAGYATYKCSSCGQTYSETTAALGHSYAEQTYISNNDATVFRDGTKKWVCDRGCGTVRQTVTDPGSKLKPTIRVSTKSIQLKRGKSTRELVVSGMAKGDYVLSWKSSNISIVKVTGKKKGTCKITAKKKTGSAVITVTLASGKTKNIKVKVVK